MQTRASLEQLGCQKLAGEYARSVGADMRAVGLIPVVLGLLGLALSAWVALNPQAQKRAEGKRGPDTNTWSIRSYRIFGVVMCAVFVTVVILGVVYTATGSQN
jgi:hypothetical protein